MSAPITPPDAPLEPVLPHRSWQAREHFSEHDWQSVFPYWRCANCGTLAALKSLHHEPCIRVNLSENAAAPDVR